MKREGAESVIGANKDKKARIRKHEYDNPRLQIALDVLFIEAVKANEEDMAMQCLDFGADINCIDIKDGYKRTALMWAARKNYKDLFIKLIEKGAQIDMQSADGWTAIRYAAFAGAEEIMNYLTQINAISYSDLLLNAAKIGDVNRISELILAGADVNAKNSDGNTALMWASAYGYTNAIIKLLELGADVNASNNDGWTALMWAAKNGHTNAIIKLVEHGAKINARDKNGYTALVWAAFNGHVDSIIKLIELGADVNSKNIALRWAAFNGHVDSIKAH